MTELFHFSEGSLPLLVSIPHDGRELAPGMEARMTEAGLALPDTDWHVRKLYEFAHEMGASVVAARYSRYVVDLNRPRTDDPLYRGHTSTRICPIQTADGEPIYQPGKSCYSGEQSERINQYWNPYHSKLKQELERIRKQFGFALLWDAHSIRSQVPRLFEGLLPELNIGTNDGLSCDSQLEAAVFQMASDSDYSTVMNQRFKGGYITRAYGSPKDNVHALQLEIAQRTYMEEKTTVYCNNLARKLTLQLRQLTIRFLNTAADSL